jgi:protein HIRA/HIR1
VKGVAWDPVGKYLASAGDDRSLLVWRTADWGLEARITKPFRETAKQETMFRRIAWSPGGDTIVATNASTSKKYVSKGGGERKCACVCVCVCVFW